MPFKESPNTRKQVEPWWNPKSPKLSIGNRNFPPSECAEQFNCVWTSNRPSTPCVGRNCFPDCMNRAQPKIIHVLAAWHAETRYHVAADRRTAPVQVGPGVRQGCKIAPWLFNTFLVIFLHDLSAHLSLERICANLNLYADDFQLCVVNFVVLQNSELHTLLRNFGIIMELLQSKGLIINTNKSAVLLTMGGTSFRPTRSQLTRRDQHGEWIKTPGLTQTTGDTPGRRTVSDVQGGHVPLLFFNSNEPTGSFQPLLKAAKEWKDQVQHD